MANIRNNTTTIQSILQTVKNLPEAGSGGGSDIPTEELVVTPSTALQNYPNGSETKFYSKVTINAVDETLVKTLYPNRVDTTLSDDVKATGASILSGKKAYVNGEEIEGDIATKTLDDLKIDETDKSKVIVPNGYYAEDCSKSVGIGTLGKPSIDSTTGKVSSTVATAGYLATNASTPTNNVLQLTTMAGNQSTPITPSTTSQKVVSEGTYTTGDIYVGAIPNQKTGGTYTLNPGETLSIASETYLTSKLNVTAATMNGESGNSIYGTVESTVNSYSINLDFVLKVWDGTNIPTLPKRILLMKGTNITSGVIAAYYQRDSGSVFCMSTALIYGQSQGIIDDGDNIISWREIGVNTLCPTIKSPTNYLFTSGYYYAIVQFE